MGTFSIAIEVGDAKGRTYVELDALVDTGASYLVVPRSVLSSLGVSDSEECIFTLADGRQSAFDVGIASLRLDNRAFPMLTVFGDDAATALLGAVALETFGLMVDPVSQRLVPTPGLLMRQAPE